MKIESCIQGRILVVLDLDNSELKNVRKQIKGLIHYFNNPESPPVLKNKNGVIEFEWNGLIKDFFETFIKETKIERWI